MTIYENIQRLQELSGPHVGANVVRCATEIREALHHRAQEALDIVGTGSPFAQELEEIKQLASEEERRVKSLNATLTAVINSEAGRLMGTSG